MTSTASANRAPRWLPANASAAAFPLGGIGTGNVSIGARGELRDWETRELPRQGHVKLPFSFFAIDVRGRELEPGDPRARVEAPAAARGRPGLLHRRSRRTPPPARLPPARRVPARRRRVRRRRPARARCAWRRSPRSSRWMPHASGIPVAVLRYRVTNPTDAPLDVTVAGSLANPVGAARPGRVPLPGLRGPPAQRVPRHRPDPWRALRDRPRPLTHCATAPRVSPPPTRAPPSKPQWLWGFWQDGVQVFWDDLRGDGRLAPEPVETLETGDLPDWITRLRIGSLAIHQTLAPGETRDFEFRLTWHFPNRPQAWLGNINLPNPNADRGGPQPLRDTVRRRVGGRGAGGCAAARARGIHPRLPRRPVRHQPAAGGARRREREPRGDPQHDRASGSRTARSRPGRAASTTPAAARAPAPTSGATRRVSRTCSRQLERSARRTEFLLETREDGRHELPHQPDLRRPAVGLPPRRRRPAGHDRAAVPRMALQRG